MSVPPSARLELPAMLHGHPGDIRRALRSQGKAWAREYLKKGVFTPPRSMLQVPPDELLEMRSGLLFDDIPRWRIHMFSNVFMSLNEHAPREQCARMEEAFESFCLTTPWGALYHAVTPPPLRSAERMARRLAALLRCWDVLQGPRYVFWPLRQDTLEELMERLYRKTLEAWCPHGSASVREHLALVVERMTRATREDCMQAVLRLMPVLVAEDTQFKHREALGDPGFLRERLSTLAAKDFEDVSSAHPSAVTTQLADWDRGLGQASPGE